MLNFLLGCLMLAIALSVGFFLLNLIMCIFAVIITAIIALFSWVAERMSGK